jgi:hypothetical protein
MRFVHVRPGVGDRVLSQVIGDLLPSAMAVALSPFPIIAIVVVLGSPRARSSGPAFAAGWLVGLTAVTVAVVAIALAGHADESGSEASTAANWLKLGVGVAFLAIAVKNWKGRPARGAEAAVPKWMAAIETIAPLKAAGFGLALSGANPKNLALTVVAATSIAQAGLDRAGNAAAIAVYVLLGSLSVAGAVLYFLIAGDRAVGPLNAVRKFMSANNAVIMMVIFLLLGAKLVGDGIAGIAN